MLDITEHPRATQQAVPPPTNAGSAGSNYVSLVWQDILQSEVLQMLPGIDLPSTGPFIDYRYWANGILRWAQAQLDENGNPLYVFAIPSWETGFDESGNPTVGAFLFPVGIQVTVLQPTDDELNAALASGYHNKPALTLTSSQTGDPDERRWAAAAHAYAVSQRDANGNPYVAGIPSWEMAIQDGQTYRGVFAFSNTPGIQVLEAGRAALMDQIADGILAPAGNPNLMDTDMRTLAVAANRWATRYGGVCGAGTFGYCSSTFPYGSDEYFIYTHDVTICFAGQQPASDPLQSIVDQAPVSWPDFNNAYAALCTVLGNMEGQGPIDPRALAQAPSWSPAPIAGILITWLKFDASGNYILSHQAPQPPSGIAMDEWRQVIYTVWLELCAIEQLQSLCAYTQATLTAAQTAANLQISGAISNMQAKTDDSFWLDIAQLFEDIAYSLVWFIPGVGAAVGNLLVTMLTDVIRVAIAGTSGTSSSITIGEYCDTVANSFKAGIDQVDGLYVTIASDHGRLLGFYAYVDGGSAGIPVASSSSDPDANQTVVINALSNGWMLRTYQVLGPLFWAVGWAKPDQFEGNQGQYGEYHGLTIDEAPEGTYVEGPYYEFALIWGESNWIKSYPTPPMMSDLTQTLNINLMDIFARTEPWLGLVTWMGWSNDIRITMQGPYTR